MKRTRLAQGAAALLVTIGLAAGVAAPASATGSITWNDCFGGYTGASWYSAGIGTSYASTTREGGTCTYTAAALYYGSSSWGSKVAKNADYVVTSRAVVTLGGAHWSRNTESINKIS